MADTVVIDSRKFLNQINESAQSKVAIFSNHVQQMGQKLEKNWQLAALHGKTLFIEDVNDQKYYLADHMRVNGQIQINNIRPIRVVEAEKKALFQESCYKLVETIESNDQKGMQSAFSRMRSQRFSSKVVPLSGMVHCKDGTHTIRISNDGMLESDVRPQLVAAIVENLKDRVIVENGTISGRFNDGEPIKLPVTKWATRKMVARNMRNVAENAYWSKGFQDRIYKLATLVSEGKVEEAVNEVSPFLEDMEEFTLLTSKKTKTLIENALAAKAVFNQQLCDDTSTLFYRTNMRINRSKIIDEWRNIAKKSEHSVLMNNVQTLQESKNFENAYDKFLQVVFEAISNREVAAEALATTLEVLRNRTPKIKESHELSSKLNGLINRLKQKNFDDASIYEAEDLIATIQEELSANETLGDFDHIPGDTDNQTDMNATPDLGGLDGDSGQAPVININSPLIQIGGKSSAATPEDDLGMGEAPPSEDDELDSLLNPQQGQQTPPQPQAPPQPQMNQSGGAPQGGQQFPSFEGKSSKSKSINESKPVHYEMRDEDDTDENNEEVVDPYAIKENVKTKSSLALMNYGASVLNTKDLTKAVNIMRGLATEHKLTGNALKENLVDMAKASLDAIGLRIPTGQQPQALEQVISLFECDDDCDDEKSEKKPWKKPWEKDDTDEEDVVEDQYKGPWVKPRGFKRANLKKDAPKATTTESIVWKESQQDAMLGEYSGIKFIFDHGGASKLTPAILSQDGQIEVPIPDQLFESAFAAAKMSNGDPKQFVRWLSESIEQLRPISDEENQAIEEAVATITAGPDGTISVEVTGEVEVNELDNEMGGELDGEMGGEMGDEMQPVDSLNVDVEEEPLGDSEDEMPNFEPKTASPMTDEVSEVPEAEIPGDVDSEDEMSPVETIDDDDDDDDKMFEDKDITNPKSAKYSKHLKDNKREMPTPKMPPKNNDNLESIGPALKKDDGSGTKPPFAGKGDSE